MTIKALNNRTSIQKDEWIKNRIARINKDLQEYCSAKDSISLKNELLALQNMQNEK